MSDSMLVDIADELVDELNAHQFAEQFTAVRSFLPRYGMDDVSSLKVTVLPRAGRATLSGGTRGERLHEYDLDIGIQQKVSDLEGSIESLLELTHEIELFVSGLALGTDPEASWVASEQVAVAAPEHLDRLRVFTSILTVTFRVWAP